MNTPPGSTDPDIPAPVTTAGETIFITLRRAALTDTQFTMLWQSELTFLLLDKPLNLHIDDETGPNAIGSDTLRLDLSVDPGLPLSTWMHL